MIAALGFSLIWTQTVCDEYHTVIGNFISYISFLFKISLPKLYYQVIVSRATKSPTSENKTLHDSPKICADLLHSQFCSSMFNIVPLNEYIMYLLVYINWIQTAFFIVYSVCMGIHMLNNKDHQAMCTQKHVNQQCKIDNAWNHCTNICIYHTHLCKVSIPGGFPTALQ